MITARESTDTAVREFSHLVLKLRDDLKFSFSRYDGRDCYVVEDPVRSKFYRIGVAEYRFLARFDGVSPVAKIVGEAARELGKDAFSEYDAVVIVDWLLDSELAVSRGTFRTDRLMAGEHKRRDAAFLKSINLMFIKVPMMNPDRMLSLLFRLFGWISGPWFAFVWAAVVLSGLWLVTSDFSRFVSSSASVFSVHNWLQIILIWSGLKIVHEFFHGLVCKRYGGDILEAGVIFVLFAPIGYVDATSSWRFGSKWQRIHTAVAGMYIEFFLAGCAAWVWATTADPYLAQIAQNIVLIASVNTLLFNANPLMKFDGYYAFADWLEIPNLYSRGQEAVKRVTMRVMMGIPAGAVLGTMREQIIVHIYGFLSLLWRVVVVATLLIVANTLFHGAGVAVAALSAVVLLGVPLWRLAGFLFNGNQQHKPRLLRFATAMFVLLSTGWMIVGGVHVAPKLTAPAVVDFASVDYVRAGSEGFVTEVMVRAGDRVDQGDVLVQLENRELEMTVAELEIRRQSVETRRRVSLHAGDVAAAQADAREIETINRTINEHRELAEALTIRAPASGEIMGRNIESLIGRFVARGDTLLSLADSRQRELRVSIAQNDVSGFRDRVGERIQVHVNGSGSDVLEGALESIDPRASDRVYHEAITALAGGPIQVRAVPDEDGYRFTSPRFNALINQIDRDWETLRAGQTALVTILGSHESIGVLWYRKVSKWVKQTVALANGMVES